MPEEKLGALGGLAAATAGHRLCHSVIQSKSLRVSSEGCQLNGEPLLPTCTVLGTKTGLTNTGSQDTHPY